jgi:hypothetical protein
MLSISTARIQMALHLFVLLLVICLLLLLVQLWRLDWFHFRPSSSQGGAKRSTLSRQRHRLAAQTTAPPVVWPPLPCRLESQRMLLCGPGVR